jgi:hypothetical protein
MRWLPVEDEPERRIAAEEGCEAGTLVVFDDLATKRAATEFNRRKNSSLNKTLCSRSWASSERRKTKSNRNRRHDLTGQSMRRD